MSFKHSFDCWVMFLVMWHVLKARQRNTLPIWRILSEPCLSSIQKGKTNVEGTTRFEFILIDFQFCSSSRSKISTQVEYKSYREMGMMLLHRLNRSTLYFVRKLNLFVQIGNCRKLVVLFQVSFSSWLEPTPIYSNLATNYLSFLMDVGRGIGDAYLTQFCKIARERSSCLKQFKIFFDSHPFTVLKLM